VNSVPARTYEAGSSFRPAFFFLGRERRLALSAYYGYARAVDDIADDPALPAAAKLEKLSAWNSAVQRIFSGAPADDPLERDLSAAVSRFPLKQEHFMLMLEGVTLDLEKREYADYAALRYYMYRVASTAGLACLAISGYEAPGPESSPRSWAMRCS
jgi:phytoene synthase